MTIPLAYLPNAPVHCPGCHVALTGAPESCPRCGYSAGVCLQRFPFQPPPLERLTDPELRFDPEARGKVDELINAIEAEFPQVRIHLCVGPLGEGVDVREFGFWLFNAATPRNGNEHDRRSYSALIVVDTTNRCASLTIGYRLDPLIGDETLARILEAGRRDLRAHRRLDAMTKILRELHHALLVAHRTAEEAARRVGRRRSSTDRDLSHAEPLAQSPGW